jgi:hypothetical protein
MEELEEKKNIESAVIRKHIPKNMKDLLSETPEERKKRAERREALKVYKVEPAAVEDASEVEVNVEPKNLSSHLFKFGLDMSNLDGVLEAMKNQISDIQANSDSNVEEVQKMLHSE